MATPRLQRPVVITGGGRRIGLALARHFIHTGQPVIISYRTRYPEVAQLEALGVVCLAADFSTSQGVTAFAAQVREQAGSLRALIHNASQWLPESADVPLTETLATMLQIHVNAPYLLNHLLSDLLCGQGPAGADIIHFTDYVAGRGSDKHIAYAASKAALENMTLSFARKFAPEVKVNAIAPALIMFHPDDSDSYRQQALDKSLMKIAPGEQEIVELVSYLLRSRYVTGRSHAVDGGRHLR
ncbi:dihydromonapterin reductase [Shimwellia blattae]|uniref:Dihydromonapterin reductase n=1 Tax=Shimwellia blattae (strain ATCC 29907 / DSM 4481 / JCM 1650 / NBRC 105725 / CDC 9005-74) TaxID=630626 RepID=I2B9X6_SHIBC|nr:dihydromonapterin reductase [Shimwellia blattae]AFJ47330.1 putative oxidoreductase YdgB [Shimwellia blattae DSM 4481 = NBRC 105725]GAB80475.1 dihydrofolate reductase FolM [Shimwellia blattae DSM 4481 = NBRC 105725]VDY64826.1 Dihydrofolate reductase folM [Shimwellia blattae]VEC22932.1 Dihydrofolate reductase folM [Shimwellia blattae]